MMISAEVRFSDVLEALGVSAIPDCKFVAGDKVQFDTAEIDDWDLPDCDVCRDREDEEAHAVNAALVKDFVAAIHAGDMVTARCLVGRVFEIEGDVAEVDAALARRVA